jgi:hypothetical protein
MWPAAEIKENEVRRNLADLVAGVAAKTETKLRY